MTTRHLVDPEILPMLDMFPGLNLTTESLPQMRALLKEMNAQMLAALPEYPEIAVSELDDRTVTLADPHPFTGEFVWTPEANRFGWTALLGQEPGGPSVSPYAAAARAQQLERLPPAYIAVGTLDLFLEEDMEYARRLIRAGVPTELHVYPGAFHGFPMVADAKVAQAHTRDYLKALSRAFNKS